MKSNLSVRNFYETKSAILRSSKLSPFWIDFVMKNASKLKEAKVEGLLQKWKMVYEMSSSDIF